jgi:cytochrome c biogenesis protein CcdA
VRFSLGVAFGAGLFLAVLGLGIASGGEGFFAGITFTSTLGRLVRLVVGSLLVLLGLMQIGLINGPNSHYIEAKTSKPRHRTYSLKGLATDQSTRATGGQLAMGSAMSSSQGLVEQVLF